MSNGLSPPEPRTKSKTKPKQSDQAKVSHWPRAAAGVSVKKAWPEPAGTDQNLRRRLAHQVRKASRGEATLVAAALPRIAKHLAVRAENRDLSCALSAAG